MLKDILSKLTEDKAENRQYLENQINACLKDESKEGLMYLLKLRLGAYLEDEEKQEFLRATRPQTYLKLYEIVRKYVDIKDFDNALKLIDGTLDYITSFPDANPPGVAEDTQKYQFDSFAEMLVFCTKYPKTNCMWVAKDEVAFLKLKAYILIDLKRLDEARVILNRILERNPMDMGSHLELFEISKLEKKIDEGVKHLHKVFNEAWYIEDYARMLRAYGYYYLEKCDYEAAKAYYLISLMYDSSVEADRYVNNELKLIKEKQGDKFNVLPPAETAKFMNARKLPYLLPTATTVNLMKTLKKMYELKIDAQKRSPEKENYWNQLINSFESNFVRVTLNHKEYIEVVKTDVYTNKLMHTNALYRFSYKADKNFRQALEKFANNPETQNIVGFLYKTNEKNLVEGFPISVIVDKALEEKDTQESLVEDYIARLNKNGFSVKANTQVVLPEGMIANKLIISKEKETSCSYLFNIGPRVFGVVTTRVEHEGDESESYLTEIVETWKYFDSNKSKLDDVLDKVYSGYHSMQVHGRIGKDKMLKFASEVEFMLARLIPIQNKKDALWEITGRKLVVGYVLKELKIGTARQSFNFEKLKELLDDSDEMVKYFTTDDEVIGYYTKAAITSPDKTRASYFSCAKSFLIELDK